MTVSTPTVEEVVRALDSQAKLLHQASSEIGCAGHYGWGNTCSWAADAIEDAIALLQSLAKDAERYRFLESQSAGLFDGGSTFAVCRPLKDSDLSLSESIDTAIDLARGQS